MAKSLIYIDVSGIRRRLAEDLKERTPAQVEAWLIRRGLRLQWDGTWIGDDARLNGLGKSEFTVLQRL